LFWIIAILMTAIALACVLPVLLAGRRRTESRCNLAANTADGGRFAQSDRESSAGVFPPVRNDSARAGLDSELRAESMAHRRRAPRVPLVLALAVPALAVGLYLLVGDPGAVDLNPGIVARDAADSVTAMATRDELVRHLARSPRDGRGWVMLARIDFASDRYADAGAAYERAIAASPKVAGDAAVWCEWADALGMAQGGSLEGRPRELVQKALNLNPAHPKALEMAGSAAFEAQDFGTAARYWRELLTLLPARDRAREELAAAIERADEFGSRAGAPAARPAAVR
jgi:cytochrome c-type biogenesis protein CcmH